jgi:hypothetical protein
MRKVKLEIIRPWVTKKLIELSGSSEDDVLIEYAMSLLEDTSKPVCSSLSILILCSDGFVAQIPDPRKIQIQMQGFLAAQTPIFMADLWKLLMEAQANPLGVPQSMIEEYKRQEVNKPSIRMGSRFDAGPTPGDSGGRGPHDRRNDRGDSYGDRGRGGGDRGRRRGRGRGGYQGGEGRYGDRYDDHEVHIPLSFAGFSLTTRFSSEVLRGAAVLQGTVRDHPLDDIVPGLTLQDRGVDPVLIPHGRVPRPNVATDLHHLGVVDTPIVQGHALSLHTVMVGEDVLHLVGEVGVRPGRALPEVGPSANDAAATRPRSTLPVPDHLPGVPLSKIAVGLGRRPGPGPGQGHLLGRGKCAVHLHLHLAGVLIEVQARAHARGHQTCAAIGLGAALLGTSRKNPGLHL